MDQNCRRTLDGSPVCSPTVMPHPAIFPERLAEDQILTWTDPGDLVYDPFLGSGTTAVIAERNNRQWLASEISAEYYNLGMHRLSGPSDIQLT